MKGMKELPFPVVYSEDQMIGYGGNQEWFHQEFQRRAGCASVCAANILSFYARNDPAFARLYPGQTRPFSQEEYLRVMNTMYSYTTPGMIGYPYVNKFGRQLLQYFSLNNVMAEAFYHHKFPDQEAAFQYVKETIDEGHPIALLILIHRAKEIFPQTWHWMTLTGYIEGEDPSQERQIIISSYGKKELLSAEKLFEAHWENIIRMVHFKLSSC